MRVIKSFLQVIALVVLISYNLYAHAAPRPIATDSRIKTFVYSANDVFRIVVHHGYQTSIEFAEGEEITMISIGNNYAWQLTPMDQRLFIKPLEENIITNMTVITNMRSYHFEVQSKLLTYTTDEELAYVIRFYYPDSDMRNDVDRAPSLAMTEQGVLKQNTKNTNQIERSFNFDYVISDMSEIAPVQVFDNGVNTFFRFDLPDDVVPNIVAKHGFGYKSLELRQRGNFIVVDTVAREYKISRGNQEIFVYKQNNS